MVVWRRVVLACNPVRIGAIRVQLVRVGRIGPQYSWCVGLAGEVGAIEGVP
jgi:hypothetical protein